MRPRLAAAVCLPVVLLGSALAGCQADDEPASEKVSAVALPDDLCAAVEGQETELWHLTEASHTTENAAEGGPENSTATCTMTGKVPGPGGGPVTLELSMTSYSGSDQDAVDTRVGDNLADQCSALEAAGKGTFEEKDNRCSSTIASGPQRGTMTEISRSIPSHGLVRVHMEHHGKQYQLVPASVVAFGGTLANSDPDDLG